MLNWCQLCVFARGFACGSNVKVYTCPDIHKQNTVYLSPCSFSHHVQVWYSKNGLFENGLRCLGESTHFQYDFHNINMMYSRMMSYSMNELSELQWKVMIGPVIALQSACADHTNELISRSQASDLSCIPFRGVLPRLTERHSDNVRIKGGGGSDKESRRLSLIILPNGSRLRCLMDSPMAH